ncbi:Lon protease family protein [Solemya velum gill symbiont]|uniref:Lon protease family protein n=1 Tax=Solemya velum gill symbiont TaxID=2340 RepID=UPI0009968498|nr:ATP-binding protein [Solemya velum gill symbiont]OOY51885.1 hypothetical protein BOV97_07295 [Solemya velum gill symbiont]OOY55995.1 hypothetical protein BOV99_06295 [Solemya velum gill symbiont]OOY57319.1 hypothetical protein BOW00_06095 [Solemya velum gill symbiont]OOY60179.1 hypothetical protein BOW02_06645 [Solemya velum gill symbiont]OOY61624.1 hypothetical protein BOW04_08110 [Solemya velum gill symbiont]
MHSVTPLLPGDLNQSCDPGSLPFKTTDELEDLGCMLGQERAVEAIELGTGHDLQGFNLFVLGPAGTGRHSFIRQFLQEKASKESVSTDWCYVNNFDEPRKPKAIELPAGRGRRFRDDMTQLVKEASSALPTAFESEDYHNRRQEIEQQANQAQEKAFQEVKEQAEELDLGIIQTATGFTFVPLHDGVAITPEEYNKLSEKEQERLQQDIADHAEIILQASSGEEEGANSIIADPDEIDPQSAILRRYSVNLLVDRNDSDGAPVIFEDHPAYPFLVGQIEHESQYGNLVTDFTLIRPGALHRANGGYLVIDVRKILIEPLAWEALKRALKSREIDTKSIAQAYSLIGTVSLEPEPIPLDVKVVLIGDREYYYLLMEYDPEFLEHFKVAADFEDDMERSDENMLQLARLVASIVRKEELKPLDNSAVARVIEESSRNAGDAQMLSTRMRRIADIVREAHYWATRNDNSVIGTDEVRSAIRMQQRRMSRIRDRLLRETLRNTILIDSEGEMPGQVNGLATIQLGNFIFGHPVRITANSSLGAGKVIDIEREVELGGPIHSKGVLILSSFLASRYVTDRPLSLSASLVFEQSYGPIEGDSASAAELCALLSSLAQAPIKQSIAITGSVNQHGQIQPIGGANQKIEGFYDLCKARGLTGGQGVIIPASNVKHLMLKQSVVDAVANGQFNIYAVSSIDECMTILTGLEAGERNHKGEFPEQSLNQRVVMRLKEFADRQKKSSG